MTTIDTEYKENKQFSKSIGAGMKSIFATGGRTFYVLEHKVSSEKYRAGQSQEIIIDYIELGRDPKCQICFGNTFPTVSRRHAAITRENNNWILKQLSTTNPTFINGRPLKNQWFLQNGDEIQLSSEGPKIGFLIPANPSVKSIGLSRRLSLFRQQALKPYKKAMVALSILFFVSISILGYYLIQSQNQIVDLIAQNKDLYKTSETFKGNVDSLQNQILQSKEVQKNLEKQLKQVRKIAYRQTGATSGASVPEALDMAKLFPSVYFIKVDKVVLELGNDKETTTDFSWSGTGFLMDNGQFVTARHVIEPWYFIDGSDENMLIMNMIASNGGSITAYFTAYSPDGSKISFNSSSFICNRYSDEINTSTDEDGNPVVFKIAGLNANDWAYSNMSKKGVITSIPNINTCLKQQQKLHILGYPMGLGTTSLSNISPIYGNCIISSTQLQAGYIPVTDRNFEHGNSGGPVFYFDETEGKYYVVGIVSAGAGSNTGFIVPISALR